MLRLVLARLESTAGGVWAALATYSRLASLAVDKDPAPPLCLGPQLLLVTPGDEEELHGGQLNYSWGPSSLQSSRISTRAPQWATELLLGVPRTSRAAGSPPGLYSGQLNCY